MLTWQIGENPEMVKLLLLSLHHNGALTEMTIYIIILPFIVYEEGFSFSSSRRTVSVSVMFQFEYLSRLWFESLSPDIIHTHGHSDDSLSLLGTLQNKFSFKNCMFLYII